MLVGWNAFKAAHARSFMVYADLLDASQRQLKFTMLGSLLKELRLDGDYALFPEKEQIRIALERKESARALAGELYARPAARESGWAGQWAFVFDDIVMEKIRSLLPQPARRGMPRAAVKRRAPF